MSTNSPREPMTDLESKKIGLFGHVKWEHLAAGVSGGVISTLVLHPLDLIKVRFQVNEGTSVTANMAKRPEYHSILDAFGKIHKAEGVRGLYQGVTPNVWGSGASWGLYFLFYSSIKKYMQGDQESVPLSAGGHMKAAAEAGVLTLALTNPIWVAKTRLCLQYEAISAEKRPVQYNSMLDCLVKIYRVEGFRGLYKGFTPGLFGVSHGAIQFMVYEELKKVYNKHKDRPTSGKFTTVEYLGFAAVSKILAASVTYPYQVVRARLQDQHRAFDGVWDVIVKTYRAEGSQGFFKGLVPNLLRVVPACCITFVVYENMIGLLSGR